MSIFDNPNFKPIERVVGKPAISITKNGIGFSKQAISKLKYSHYVQVYINYVDKQIAIRSCEANEPNATQFVPLNKDKVISIRWNNQSLISEIRKMVDETINKSDFKIEGEYLQEDSAVLFKCSDAVSLPK